MHYTRPSRAISERPTPSRIYIIIYWEHLNPQQQKHNTNKTLTFRALHYSVGCACVSREMSVFVLKMYAPSRGARLLRPQQIKPLIRQTDGSVKELVFRAFSCITSGPECKLAAFLGQWEGVKGNHSK